MKHNLRACLLGLLGALCVTSVLALALGVPFLWAAIGVVVLMDLGVILWLGRRPRTGKPRVWRVRRPVAMHLN